MLKYIFSPVAVTIISYKTFLYVILKTAVCKFGSPTDPNLLICFVQNMEEMEKSHEAFMQGAQQELRKEMATLQKKILMDTVSSVVWVWVKVDCKIQSLILILSD